MSCSCRTEIEWKLQQRFREGNPKATDHKAVLTGYGIVVDGPSLREVGKMPVFLTANFPKKAGGTQLKNATESMFFTYCPFCGKKYKEETL